MEEMVPLLLTYVFWFSKSKILKDVFRPVLFLKYLFGNGLGFTRGTLAL